MVLGISKLARFILFSLVLISSIQVLGLILPIYNYLDEVILLILLGFVFLNKEKIRIERTKVTLILMFLVLTIISCIVNFYAVAPIFIKSIFYLKSGFILFLIPFLSNIYSNKKLENRIFILIIILCFISIVEFSIVQFIIFKLEVKYSLLGLPIKSRDGIYRAYSLTGHPINLGMVAFIGIVYLYEKFKKSYFILTIILLASLIFSGTRIPLLLVVIYFLIKLYHSNIRVIPKIKFKHVYLLLFPAIIGVAIIKVPGYLEEKNEIQSTRGISTVLGFKLLDDPLYAIFGTGVGSYGSYESIEYGSNIYNQVGYPESYKRILTTGNRSTGMESIFFMMIFENGIIATILFYLILIPLNVRLNIMNIFFASIIVIISLVYPIYTLPFIFMFTILFPRYTDQKEVIGTI